MPISLNLNSVVVNGMETDAGVFIGDNVQFGWNSHQKRNSGIGIIIGAYNFFPNACNNIYDQDVNDGNVLNHNIELFHEWNYNPVTNSSS